MRADGIEIGVVLGERAAVDGRARLVLAWAATLAVSGLGVPFALAGSPVPGWVPAVQAGAVVLAIVAASLVRPLRSLLPYLVVLLFVLPAVQGLLWPAPLAAIRFANPLSPGNDLGEQVRELGLALAMVVALVAMRRSADGLFLGVGRPAAPATPAQPLIDAGWTWRRVGTVGTLGIAAVTLAFLVLGSRSLDVGRLLAAAPAALVLAVPNALSEELLFRAGPLGALERVVGGRAATWLLVALFGLAHVSGVPGGLPGIAMAGVLAWFAGRSLLDTRGLGWALALHVLLDLLIFSFLLGAAVG